MNSTSKAFPCFIGIFFSLLITLLLIPTAEAISGKDVDEDNSNVVSFEELCDASIRQDFSTYNNLSKKYNLSQIVGSNVANLNEKNPTLNSFDLLHQMVHLCTNCEKNVFLASSTNAFLKYEGFFLAQDRSLSEDVIRFLVKQNKKPLIFFKGEESSWHVLSNEFMESKPLHSLSQLILDEHSSLFPKSGDNLQFVRACDFIVMDKELNVVSNPEFKTKHNGLSQKTAFDYLNNQNFWKSCYVDRQLLDIENKKMYQRTFDGSVNEIDIKKLDFSQQSALNQRFNLSRKFVTNKINHPKLQCQLFENISFRIFLKFMK